MQQQVPVYTLSQLVVYFLQLGTWGFGGPVALTGYMYRDLVERKAWITEADYKEGLALAQLAPGPLAAQLGIYIGYIHYRVWGATLAGLAFVLPSFLMVLAIGYIYITFQGIPQMQAVFYGVGAAVIGIITISAYKLTTKTLGKDKLLWSIFLIAGSYTVILEQENVVIFIAAGIVYYGLKYKKVLTGKTTSSFAIPLLLSSSFTPQGQSLWQMFLFFCKAGAFVFGSGLAIVPFLYGGLVKEHGWLNEQQFMDAVAVAMITPGPVVITVGFIGFLISGFPGACVAAIATFFPCYLFTVLPAPYFRKYGKHPGIKAFVDGVTAAATGTIAGAVIVLGKRAIVDGYTLAMALITAIVLWQSKKIPEPLVILIAALLGIMIHFFKQ
ncbi:chromate transporter [Chitinophaga skermanii]|uniref:Chromate transporter n=1 Tax=Chitinophaga skermanii TaxID=331697 RepID=A0A327QMX2_9BACT|nr:chromate transporter [Chitinophaga skermanii]RAJ05044.1 chromate transporter [Chitinophaga skermanii]